ncbi:hypothetical protein [Asanoa iriomotensis]|uniref:Uncharacterized protein n=1 Tax=Asanoa iriomotensis TaxID=234613 RepID=A0ABQ4BYM7_9ACTN|nr:hypothetical protein [Asanoa iriomotensis]GIF55637.1 hypothetical protein Air01nite_17320 [Asanoa iriomotensis]
MSDELERRYRRLLVFYPWSHRRVYEEEMVAVLVAGARPGQRRPTPGETVNLIASGLRTRAGAAMTSMVGPAWRDAAVVFGLLAAVVLLSQRVVRLSDEIVYGLGVNAYPSLRALGWAAVVVAVLVGLRRSAAVLAWVTVLGEAVLIAQQYRSAPVTAVQLFWPLTLGIVAAAALSVPAARGRAIALLRWRLAAFVAGVGAAQTIQVLNHQQAWSWREAGVSYTWFGLENRSELGLYLWTAVVAVGALTAAVAVLTLPAAVRWRVAALATPVVTLAAQIRLTLSGWATSNGHMGHPIYLVPIQWTLLVAAPVIAFALAAAFAHWREQTARLTALGRAADRESLGA